jgi:octopine/nopaline transport system permease protein
LQLFELLGFGPKGWGEAILLATGMTLLVTLVSMLIGAVLGAVIASAKLSKRTWSRVIGEAYTTVFRGEPELLVIYLFYFGGAQAASAFVNSIGIEGRVVVPPFLGGVLAVGAICGAYQAEVFRGAFLAITRGELEAGRAYGMSPTTLFRRIVVPQVLRIAIPGLGNVWQLSVKDSALVSVTGVAELMRQSSVAARSTHQPFLFLLTAGALYLVLTTVSTFLFDWAEAHTSRSLVRT